MHRFLTPRSPGPSKITTFHTLPLLRRSFTLYKAPNTEVFAISPTVLSALCTYQPLVALESTIYTHGFPYPDNIALALDLEEIVRSHGAIPATCGIVKGVARVGLSVDEIVALASAAGKEGTRKVSRRDLPWILGMGLTGKKLNGGTTVSGTMYLAKMAGIEVFGTGGLGGVHRGGENSLDISADLTELGRTNIAVISSGCKSFLDIPRTLEYLETQGVMVATFADGRGADVDVPAFYTRDSGYRSPMVVQGAEEAAAVIWAQRQLKGQLPIKSGLLFANPIPAEFSIPKAEMDEAIDQAVREAAEQGFHGHANTPFILSRIKDLTSGRSLPANRALIESNVAMAAKVAVELARFKEDAAPLEPLVPGNRERKITPATSSSSKKGRGAKDSAQSQIDRTFAAKVELETRSSGGIPPNPDLVRHPLAADMQPVDIRFLESRVKGSPEVAVFGSVALDVSCDYQPMRNMNSIADLPTDATQPAPFTSNIASISHSIGGVGHNVALAAHRIMEEGEVQLYSVVADDLAGKQVLAGLKAEGFDTSGIQVLPQKLSPPRTAQYVAINDAKKDLALAMADMEIFQTNEYYYGDIASISRNLKWAVIDANAHPSATRDLITSLRTLERPKKSPPRIAYEPVSVAKSGSIFKHEKPLPVFPNHQIHLTTPNQHELEAMHTAAKEANLFASDQWWRVIDSLGIPGTGARDRFEQITNRSLTDQGIPLMNVQLLPFIPTILTKLGKDGVLLTQLLGPADPRLVDPEHAKYVLSRCQNGNRQVGGVYMRLYTAVEEVIDVISVNGVGDTFLGVLVAGLASGLQDWEQLILLAQRGAVMTLKSREAVSPELGVLKMDMEKLRVGPRLEVEKKVIARRV